MAEWTQEQIDRINDDHWIQGKAVCPICGATVGIHEVQQVGYPKQLLANCPGCKARAQIRSAPQLGERFGEEELREYVDLFLKGGESVCPHDGTSLDVRDRSGIGGSRYRVTCPRCGATGLLEWSPEG